MTLLLALLKAKLISFKKRERGRKLPEEGRKKL
jgi:hypothetical protein